jgi:putative ABC transport system substrate-binding protein
MRRRDVLSLLGGAAVSWPLRARVQQPAMPVIGFLGGTSLDGYVSAQVAALRQGLNEAGFIEGQNVAIEFRWAEGQYDRLPTLAAEFVSREVAVIFASSLPAALAAKGETSAIPIVFVMGADPVTLGVAASLNQPGGNVTGISQYYGALGAKRLELLQELIPSASSIAIISNPKNPDAEDHLNDVQAAAHVIGQQTEVFRASTESQIDAAFADLVRRGNGALLVADDPFFSVRRSQIVTWLLATRYPRSIMRASSPQPAA